MVREIEILHWMILIDLNFEVTEYSSTSNNDTVVVLKFDDPQSYPMIPFMPRM